MVKIKSSSFILLVLDSKQTAMIKIPKSFSNWEWQTTPVILAFRWSLEEERLEVQGSLPTHSELEPSLGYIETLVYVKQAKEKMTL